MPRFDPLCGRVSFEKAAKFIAICDLVVCCLYVLSHFVGGGYVYEEKSEDYESELSKVLKVDDSPSTGMISTNYDDDNDQSTSTTTTTTTPRTVLTYQEYKELMRIGLPSIDVLIVLVLCMLIFSIAHVAMEVWLCRLLLKAATHKDGSALKTWFWCRLGVTVMFTLYSIVGLLTVKRDFVDWIFETLNIYRIYTLYVIYCFKSHVSACASLHKPMEM